MNHIDDLIDRLTRMKTASDEVERRTLCPHPAELAAPAETTYDPATNRADIICGLCGARIGQAVVHNQ